MLSKGQKKKRTNKEDKQRIQKKKRTNEEDEQRRQQMKTTTTNKGKEQIQQ